MVMESYCPFCQEDYNTIDLNMVKCMNCYREYPLDQWEEKVKEAGKEIIKDHENH